MTSWEQVTTTTFDPVSAPLKRMTIYRATSVTPGSGPITISFSATVSNAQWIVSQFSGVDQSGSDGSGAIVQTAVSAEDAASGLSPQLAAFADANDVSYGVFGVASSTPAVSAGAGFQPVVEVPSGETPADLFAEWTTDDPTVNATWSALNGAGLAVEIQAGAVP